MGNKKQYQLNKKVLEKIKAAKDVGDDDLRNELLEEGEQLLIECNKHICIAEKYGWDTIESYTTDPIASDSDDEKIKKVIKECKLLREEKRKAKLLKSQRLIPMQRGVERRVILEKPPSSSAVGKVPTVSVTHGPRTCFRPRHLAHGCRAATTSNGSGQSHSSGLASSS